jgi:hypothetical protein
MFGDEEDDQGSSFDSEASSDSDGSIDVPEAPLAFQPMFGDDGDEPQSSFDSEASSDLDSSLDAPEGPLAFQPMFGSMFGDEGDNQESSPENESVHGPVTGLDQPGGVERERTGPGPESVPYALRSDSRSHLPQARANLCVPCSSLDFTALVARKPAKHHSSVAALRASSRRGCPLCRLILKDDFDMGRKSGKKESREDPVVCEVWGSGSNSDPIDQLSFFSGHLFSSVEICTTKGS